MSYFTVGYHVRFCSGLTWGSNGSLPASTDTGGSHDAVVRDLSPKELLLFASSSGDQIKLDRVWLRVARGGNGSGDAAPSLVGVGAEYRIDESILGPNLGKEQQLRNLVRRYTGAYPNGGRDLGFHEWPADEMLVFDIDGRNGEKFTEVATAWAGSELRAFKVKTSVAMLKASPLADACSTAQDEQR